MNGIHPETLRAIQRLQTKHDADVSRLHLTLRHRTREFRLRLVALESRLGVVHGTPDPDAQGSSESEVSR